jgi:LacI family transcriptional regulator
MKQRSTDELKGSITRRTVAMGMPESSPLLYGAVQEGKRLGWNMVQLQGWGWQLPEGIQIDGLICASIESELAWRFIQHIPFSVGISVHQLFKTTATVAPDRAAAGVQAAQYYLQRGFTNFATAAYQAIGVNDSIASFRKCVEEAGATCATIHSLTLDTGRQEDIHEILSKQIRPLRTPLAIFCVNDRLASRICSWCLQDGLAVPEQVAILGTGNDPVLCQCSPVPLSSLDSRDELLGKEAARLLERIMTGEEQPKEPVLIPPTGVLTRRSTDITAIADVRAARALRYIWDHYRDNIGPDEVAAACRIPRRSLDRHFKSAVGRTVTAEILSHRMSIAEDLLGAGDSTVTEIAARIGFRSSQYFNLQFKRWSGMTPLSYRKHARKSP